MRFWRGCGAPRSRERQMVPIVYRVCDRLFLRSCEARIVAGFLSRFFFSTIVYTLHSLRISSTFFSPFWRAKMAPCHTGLSSGHLVSTVTACSMYQIGIPLYDRHSRAASVYGHYYLILYSNSQVGAGRKTLQCAKFANMTNSRICIEQLVMGHPMNYYQSSSPREFQSMWSTK